MIRVRDNLGNPHLHLDSYQAFLRHVYMPLQQRPHEAKIDDKKRIVLAFVVTDKDKVKRRLAELEAEAKTLRAKMEEIERQRAKAAEAKAKKEKLERQAALAKEQAKVRAQHASARPAAAAAVAAATAAKVCLRSFLRAHVRSADPRPRRAELAYGPARRLGPEAKGRRGDKASAQRRVGAGQFDSSCYVYETGARGHAAAGRQGDCVDGRAGLARSVRREPECAPGRHLWRFGRPARL